MRRCMIIRSHCRADAGRIGEILADGWRDTYAAFMPADYLARQSDRAGRRAEIVDWLHGEFDPANEAIFVAEQDEAMGFIHMELGDKGELGATGIVNLLYVDLGRRGHGAGRALMAAGARWLLDAQPGPLVLSAFELNPSRGFYRALGGIEAKRLTHSIAGRDIVSVLYFWPDPAVLMRAS
jgi:GNAT superfamily N-acetyltransferase